MQHPVGMPELEKRIAVPRRPRRRKTRHEILNLFVSHFSSPYCCGGDASGIAGSGLAINGPDNSVGIDPEKWTPVFRSSIMRKQHAERRDCNSTLSYRALSDVREHQIHALVREQPSLARKPAAIFDQRTVGADQAMTGHDDAERVRAIGVAERPHRLRHAELGRQCAVGHGRAGRDRSAARSRPCAGTACRRPAIRCCSAKRDRLRNIVITLP